MIKPKDKPTLLIVTALIFFVVCFGAYVALGAEEVNPVQECARKLGTFEITLIVFTVVAAVVLIVDAIGLRRELNKKREAWERFNDNL